MIVRRLAARRLVKTGSTEQEPRRKRAASFAVIVFTAGLIAGTAAWLDIWPFGNIQVLLAEVFGSSGPPQIAAQQVFPSVQPAHRTVDVYASPVPIQPSQPTAPPTSRPSHSPGPHGSPSPHGSPPPDE